MDFDNKNILVTGAAGFIGSHLVQQLVKKGSTVRAMTHYRSDPSLHNLEYLSSEELARVKIFKGNIEDPFFVRRCVEGCDAVFHLAALIGIPYSYIAPASYISTNIQGTLNILEACRTEGIQRVVHTSTSECYGSAKYTPIDEKHPLQGQSPYSASKIGADKLVQSYFYSFNLPVVTIRPFNTFGPRQSLRAVIPTVISQLMANNKSIKLGALFPIRDFTYVTDTVNGLLLGAITKGIEGEVINLGFGKGISIEELVKIIIKLVGKNVPIESQGERHRPEKSEVLALISDNSKASEKLGWKPQVSLKEGLEKTIKFVLQNHHLFKDKEYGI
jgi:NAD dependent epimerase/dehydratase